MPTVSTAQRHLMLAAAHTRGGYGGVPRKVAREFVGKDAAGVAAGVLHVAPDGAVLLLKRSDAEKNFSGHWGMPGGGADDGETAAQAVERECREEIGVNPAGELQLVRVRLTPTGVMFHTFLKPVVDRFTPTLNDEHTDFRWVDPDDAPRPIHPEVRNLLNDLSDGVVALRERPLETASDSLAMDRESVRRFDVDGRLHVSLTPISKAVINEYWGREIPGAESMGLLPDRQYRLFRDPQELAKAASTFNNLPLLDKHVAVSAQAHRPADVVGSTGTDAQFDGTYLANSLVIWAKSAIDDIVSDKKRELSCAYRYRADMTPGTFEGESYDGVMRDLVGNHVAIVLEGRAGSDVLVQDAKIDFGFWLL